MLPPPSIFHSITLILVAPDDSPSSLHSLHLLQLAFGAMVLLVGLHELETIANIEWLKKDLKVSLSLTELIYTV